MQQPLCGGGVQQEHSIYNRPLDACMMQTTGTSARATIYVGNTDAVTVAASASGPPGPTLHDARARKNAPNRTASAPTLPCPGRSSCQCPLHAFLGATAGMRCLPRQVRRIDDETARYNRATALGVKPSHGPTNQSTSRKRAKRAICVHNKKKKKKNGSVVVPTPQAPPKPTRTVPRPPRSTRGTAASCADVSCLGDVEAVHRGAPQNLLWELRKRTTGGEFARLGGGGG